MIPLPTRLFSHWSIPLKGLTLLSAKTGFSISKMRDAKNSLPRHGSVHNSVAPPPFLALQKTLNIFFLVAKLFCAEYPF
jgi:hypothetical protein